MTDRFEEGLRVRREVLGAWGTAWTGAALDHKTKSLLSLAILGALGRFDELGIYTKGALASGATVDEIRDVLVHLTAYCGTPAGRQAFLAAHGALKTAGALPEA